jgi:hypothetical protein
MSSNTDIEIIDNMEDVEDSENVVESNVETSETTEPAETSAIVEKHFLENGWKFTYKPKVVHTKKTQSEDDWLSSFQIIHPEIKSVEMFWSVKNNILNWSKLHHGSIYAFFKNNINPSWEDKQNKEGCSYMFYMNQNRITENDLDEIFESALLFLVGEWSEYAACVNGVTFERKYRGDKMIVWCNSHSKEMLQNIKNEMLPDSFKDFVSIDSGELNDNRFKISVKIIDHKSELQRLSTSTNRSSNK